MTEINDCNCSTCSKRNKNECPLIATYRENCKKEGKTPSIKVIHKVMEYHEETIKEHGCLSHPQAREYLNKDVIERFEEILNTACRQYHDTPRYLATGNVYEMKRYILEEAIKLIKEGVRKP